MDYQPDQSVLAKLPQVTLVAVVGPTSVGKTTLINAASARSMAIHPVLTTTNRQPRPGEEDGVDFHFRSQEEINSVIAKRGYVQATIHPTGELYATAPEDYSTEGVSVMAVMADVMPVFKSLPFKLIRTIFVLPPNWQEWQQRLVSHTFTPEQRQKRLSEACVSLQYALDTPDVGFVINGDLAQATMEFTQLALGASPAANSDACHDLAASLIKDIQKQ